MANRLHIHQRDDLPPVLLVVQRWKLKHRTPLKLSRRYTPTVWTKLLYSKTSDDQFQFSFVPSSGPHPELTTYSSPSLLRFPQNVDSMPFGGGTGRQKDGRQPSTNGTEPKSEFSVGSLLFEAQLLPEPLTAVNGCEVTGRAAILPSRTRPANDFAQGLDGTGRHAADGTRHTRKYGDGGQPYRAVSTAITLSVDERQYRTLLLMLLSQRGHLHFLLGSLR
ncbi:hypothetical protein B0H17DRAFT_1133746 [Mycena rosella]|uniref:Uncharacterized protein n=1 Tax=Mycena rosella TaxID=1033263 RepID=A0AAD7GJX5_MYCRO|nr:hypothetical protein B0H17DRAFT_1133746 [Mycena rosella]